MRVVAILLGVAAGGLVAVVSPAAAVTPPLHTHESVVVLQRYEPCGVVEGVRYDIHRTRFFGEDGSIVRSLLRIGFEGTLSIPRTGEVVEERGHQTITVEADGTFAFAGVGFNVHVPGEGVILLEAGRLVIDPDGNVTHQSANTALDLAAKVCGVLG